MIAKKTAIITGITGQDGSYLAALLLDKGYRVVGLSRKNIQETHGLKYLSIHKEIEIEECDLADITSVTRILKIYNPHEIYNLAAQSSVGISFKQPISTLQFNIISVLNLLEAIRIHDCSIKFYQASSSEMYGKVSELPIKIESSMHPLSPYAISKASAFWTVINYRESYDMFACSGVLFNHESYLRSNNFFVKKVLVQAKKMQTDPSLKLKLGNLNVKRDFGYAPKYVEAMWLMLQQEIPEDYMICSGKSIALEDIVRFIFSRMNLDYDRVMIDKDLIRPTDIEDIFGDNSAAKIKLNWDYNLDFYEVLDLLIKEENQNWVGNK